MNDPAAIRKALAEQKRCGVPFDRAWAEVVGAVPTPGNYGEGGVALFTYRAMKDAYNDTKRPRSRLEPAGDDDQGTYGHGKSRAPRLAA